MNKWLDKFESLSVVKASRKIVLPGFDGVPIYDVMVFFIKGLMKGALNTRATSLSFQFFLSLFPAIIFLFTLIPFIPIENFQGTLMELIQNVLPESAFELTANTLDDIINRPRAGLSIMVFIVLIYLATNGVDAVLEAFSESIHIEHRRSYFHQKGVAFVLMLILTLLLIICIGMIIYSTYAVNYLKELENISGVYLLNFSRYFIVISMMYFGISLLYYYGNRRKESWKFFSAGSSFTTIMALLLSYAFTYYVNNVAMYNYLYGSIGTLIVILLWIYFNSFVLLIGFELNTSIQQAGFKRKLV